MQSYVGPIGAACQNSPAPSTRANQELAEFAFDVLHRNGLDVAEHCGLEGIVSKRRMSPYRSGECQDWLKGRRRRGARRPREVAVVERT